MKQSTDSAGNGFILGYPGSIRHLPLGAELRRSASLVTKCVPANELKKKLDIGEIDAAPLPVHCLNDSGEYELAFPAGLAAGRSAHFAFLGGVGDVRLVNDLLGQKMPLIRKAFARFRSEWVEGEEWHSLPGASDIHPIVSKLFKEMSSLNGRGLGPKLQVKLFSNEPTVNIWLEIILTLVLGAENFELIDRNQVAGASADSPNRADLWVGDNIWDKRSSYSCHVDLIEAYKSITGLPLVLRVWLRRAETPIPGHVKSAVIKASELACARMKVEPSQYLDMDLASDKKVSHCSNFWKQIQYRMTWQHFLSMFLYLQLYRRLRCLDHTDKGAINLMRFEERGIFPRATL